MTKRLLIIDDNRDILEAFSLILTSHGYDITSADSIDGALEECLALKFNLVICDINFPKKSGYDFLKEFRVMFDVPVIAVSASAHAEDRLVAIAAGFNEFLVKPVLIEQLTAAIETALAESNGKRGSSSEPPLNN